MDFCNKTFVSLLSEKKIEELRKENKFESENFKSERNDFKDQIENLENEVNSLKKKQCPYPGCDSNSNFKHFYSKKHYSIESCPNWNAVKPF